MLYHSRLTKRLVRIFATVLLIFLSSNDCIALAQILTIKTNHQDVNLWSEAGRKNGHTIDQVGRFEEIQVLRSKRLKNGEIWYRVQLRRFPNDRKVEKSGWVDAKFFTSIETPFDDDQPTEARSNCHLCTQQASRRSRKNVNDLRSIGRSAERSTQFNWPVNGQIRSGFGMRRHPIKGTVKLHRGTDISGNNAAKVRAAKLGIVEVSAGGCKPGRKSCNGGAGNMVTINHGDGTKTRYMHLSHNCHLPRRGTKVDDATVLGCVGATGAVTGPHLHFEVIRNGKWTNPLTALPKRN